MIKVNRNFNELYNNRNEAAETSRQSEAALREFAQTRLNNLHAVGKSVLYKAGGNHSNLNREGLTLAGRHFDWLTARSVKITLIDNLSVSFEAYGIPGRPNFEGSVRIKDLSMSDRDYATHTRKKIATMDRIHEASKTSRQEHHIDSLTRAVNKAQAELNEALSERELLLN